MTPRTWHVQFYNDRLGIIAPYIVEALSPEDAVRAGRRAVEAEHPPARRMRRGLFARAERAANHHDSGWVLYRIRGGGAPDGDPAAVT